eukprot:jgi/Chlat1/5056/Chrsp33S05060
MQCPACGVRAALAELPGTWPESDAGSTAAAVVTVWTAVSLACASCGAKVWPCVSCHALLPIVPQQQPPASGATSSYARRALQLLLRSLTLACDFACRTFCGHCGALNVTGVRDRLRLDLPPLQALPLDQVQALQIRLVGRRSYAATKHNELTSLLKAAASPSVAANNRLPAARESSDSPMPMATAATSAPTNTPRGEGLVAARPEAGSLPHAQPVHCTQSWLWQDGGDDSLGPVRKRRRRTENFLPAQALPSSEEQQQGGDRVDGGVYSSTRFPSSELDCAIARCRWQLLQLESPAVGGAEGHGDEQDGAMEDHHNGFSHHHHLAMLRVLCSNGDEHDEAAGMVAGAESYLLSRPRLVRLKSAVTEREMVWRQSKLDTALFEQHYGPRAGISMAVVLPALLKERHVHAGKVLQTASAPHAGLLGAVNRVLDAKLDAWLKTHITGHNDSSNCKEGDEGREDMDEEEEEEEDNRWSVSEESSLPGLRCGRNGPRDAAVAARQIFDLCQTLYRGICSVTTQQLAACPRQDIKRPEVGATTPAGP